MITLNPPSPPPSEAFVSFSAEVDATSTESLLAQMAQLAVQGVPKVTLLLSTAGGSVMHGMNLYSVLKGMPFELVTHNVGNVDSIGNAIFLAGSRRYAVPQATFMFHGVGFNPQAGVRLEEKNLRELMDGIVSNHKRIGEVITERTTITEAEATELFREAQTKDVAYAVSHGIIHEVREVKVPPGVPFHALVFKR